MTPNRPATLRLALCALLGAGTAACDSPSAPPVPAAVSARTGDGQAGIAGAALPASLSVRVEDARGRPIAGVPVVFSVQEGAGSVEFTDASTDRSGIASAGTWTLGPKAGLNVVTAAVPGLPAVQFTAQSSAGAPAILRVYAGGTQSTVVGDRVSVSPTVVVLDAHENPVSGAPVTFTVLQGDGVVVGGSANGTAGATTVTLASDADGRAAPASWQVGTKAGPNTLEARVAGVDHAATFVADAEPGPAAAVVAAAGTAQTAPAGSTVALPPRVRVTDVHGNPVRDVAVTFAVSGGEGALLAPGANGGGEAANVTTSTDEDGYATVAFWRLGTRAGANALDVRAAGVGAAIRFSATAVAGPATLLTAHAGDHQAAVAGSRLPVAPAVRVADAYGNPVPGATVTFSVAGGGGAIAGAVRSTGSDGLAAIGAWDLGPVPGLNSLMAKVDGAGSVTFEATGTSSPGGTGGSGGSGGSGGAAGFTLDVRYTTPIAGSQLAAFNSAADRWNGAITGDLPDVYVTIAANGCGAPHPAVAETVDDVVIFVTVTSIDGPGKVLGSAGPCRIRSGSNLPAVGIVYLDADDLGNLEANGLLDDVVLHEMGHVLGIGTLWPTGLLIGAGGSDPVFTGSAAVNQFLAAGGSAYSGTPVPVENTGGGGTKDAHWRESVMASEIMTGWINFGGNSFSRITVASLQDMGYQVDLDAADGFQLSGVSSLGAGSALPGLEVLETALPPPIVVGATSK